MKNRRLNVFDYVVLVLVVVVVVSVFLKARSFIGTTPKDHSVLGGESYIDFRVERVRDVTTEAFNIGDQLILEETRMVFGVIESISIEPATDLANNAEGLYVESEIPNRYTMTLRVKSNHYATSKGYVVGGIDMKIGKILAIENRFSRTTGIVWSITDKE